jgi:tetratricopeptide (TPR) repeat protein
MSGTKQHHLGGKHDRSPSKSNFTVWLLVLFVASGLVLAGLGVLVAKRNPPKIAETRVSFSSGQATAATNTGSLRASTLETNAVLEAANDLDKAVELMNQGTLLLAQGRNEEAAAEFTKAIQFNPEDEDIHYNLAMALARQGKRDLAKQRYLEALRIYPDHAEAHNNLGNLLVTEGKFDEAIEHFKATLKITPESASANNNLGNALGRQGKTAEAITYFVQAMKLKPDYIEARFNLANSYVLQRRFDEAIAEFSEILRRQPDFELARKQLGKAEQLRRMRQGPVLPGIPPQP